LDDERTIEEARIENDMILYFVFKKEGTVMWNGNVEWNEVV
jgi:hypothetical protein